MVIKVAIRRPVPDGLQGYKSMTRGTIVDSVEAQYARTMQTFRCSANPEDIDQMILDVKDLKGPVWYSFERVENNKRLWIPADNIAYIEEE